MKIISTLTIYLFYALPAISQNPRAILTQSYFKCQSVTNGYYEMTNYNKYMSERDTNKRIFNCYFKKLEGDSLYPSAFHYKLLKDDILSDEIMYTGEEFVTIYNKDSYAEIISKYKWAEEIKAYKNNYTFYAPLTNYNCFSGINFLSSKQKFIYIGEENINGLNCFHIQICEKPTKDSVDPMKNIRIDYHYWINKKDSIPIQYSFGVDAVMDNDTMYQYEKFILNKYEINNLKDETILTLKSIPQNYKLTDFVPYKKQEPLPVDAVAPDWSLKSITGEKVNLKDLKGKVVLIDFFYKSCYPCMLALPALQALHEKYKDKGLQVIGINSIDKLGDSIVLFLKKRGITYPVLLDDRNIYNDYHVSGYPMMYIIDKNGKIIFSQSGHRKDMDETLEEVLKKHLL